MRPPSIVYAVYEKRLLARLAGKPMPRHVGVMCDGNRRSARASGLDDLSVGYRRGGAKIEELLNWCAEVGVRVVTLWLLSTDNLVARPKGEIEPILAAIEEVTDSLARPGRPWRVGIVGSLDLLPSQTAVALKGACARTDDRPGMQVNIAVGYGGRQEIADAVRSLLMEQADRGTTIEELAEILEIDHIAEHLYTKGQPDPDLVIRTSGEQRLSGFLLWQSAHSEFYFCDAYWPDFRKVDFLRALRDFARRNRRYGA
ncbi:MAG: isoprenyl transferase [Mycobacteriales bacterium]